MENLYKEMCERLNYLKSQEYSEENKWRIEEIMLAIVRVQQILLQERHPRKNDIKNICQYEQNNNTAMNCKHCGGSKFMHKYIEMYSYIGVTDISNSYLIN